MDKNMHKTLFHAYDILALQPTFDNVSKDDFAEQAELSCKKQQGKARDFTLAEAHFDIEVAPAKQPVTNSDGENDIEDEDLRNPVRYSYSVVQCDPKVQSFPPPYTRPQQ